MTSIGILGGGQLGQMLGEAAKSLGVTCVFYDQAKNPCAARQGKIYTNIKEFISNADIFTYEFENIDRKIVEQVAQNKPLFPSLRVLKIASDRYQEKSYFASQGIKTAEWLPLNNPQDLSKAATKFGFPFLIKSSRMGYDGKGQIRVNNEQKLSQALTELNPSFTSSSSAECPYIAEKIVPFKREISLLSVRNQEGTVAHYPIVENQHRHGILYSSIAPAMMDKKRTMLCRALMEKLLQSLSYVGVLCLEMFDTGEELLANEMAPRVHNSGHWTIEGAETSQFSNHIRSILGMALGPTKPLGFSKMFNLVGRISANLKHTKDARLHLYGKEERPGRKLGHLTYNATNQEKAEKLALAMRDHSNFIV